MDIYDNMNTGVGRAFLDFHSRGEGINVEFELWRRMAAMVSSDMSVTCGWKGKGRDMDFSDFSGYYMEDSESKVTCWSNGVTIGEVKPDGFQGVKVSGFDELALEPYLKGGDGLCEAVGALCLSEGNLKLAAEEMRHGHEVIIGMEYKGKTALAVDCDDRKMKMQLAGFADDVRFISRELFMEALEDFHISRLSHGPEPEMPQLVRFFYDGKTVYRESDKDVLEQRSPDTVALDRALTELLRDGAAQIRSELDERAGIAKEHRPFLYNGIQFPSLYMHKDTVVMLSNTGKVLAGILAVRDGKVGRYADFNLDRKLGTPVVTYSVEEALDMMRRSILNPATVAKAKEEYLNWSLSQKKQGMKI